VDRSRVACAGTLLALSLLLLPAETAHTAAQGSATPRARAACPCSLFGATATPAVKTVPDARAVELGMKFWSDAKGKVTAIRFYKGPNNTGTHIGNLWSGAGKRLSTVTFANETARGWQRAGLAQPVAISPGMMYVVSYHTNVGLYSATSGFFSSSIANPPLHAVSSRLSRNGVYAYGASRFPTSNNSDATNYWVDIVFSPG
jgi:uncharacterized protein DUF4082